MKVLIVSAGHPDLLPGAAQSVAHALFAELRGRDGVAPVLLASVDRALPALFKPGAHITAFDGRADEYLFLSHDVEPWWHRNREPLLVAAFAGFLALIRPDIVHFHDFRTLGADLLTLTRRVLPGCRLVLTLHDFLAICAADGRMVRRTDGTLCDHDSPVRCHQCFAAIPPEQFFLRARTLRSHLLAADVFVTPSRFMREFFVRWGLPAERFAQVANAVPAIAASIAVPGAPGAAPTRFGCFGAADGVDLLLDAIEHLHTDGFADFTVEIESAAPADRRHPAGVTFAGRYNGTPGQRMARTDWCVVPSVWWESFCQPLSDAWLAGCPVIAANAGAAAERVRPDVDGLLYDFADSRSLARAMRRAATEHGLRSRLAAAIAAPPSQAEMASRYLAIYRGAP